MRKIFFLIIFLIIYSCGDKIKENHEDIIKIKKGMTMKEVNGIMRNSPFKVRFTDDKKNFYISYSSHFASSGDIYIEYRAKDSVVIDTYIGD